MNFEPLYINNVIQSCLFSSSVSFPPLGNLSPFTSSPTLLSPFQVNLFLFLFLSWAYIYQLALSQPILRFRFSPDAIFFMLSFPSSFGFLMLFLISSFFFFSFYYSSFSYSSFFFFYFDIFTFPLRYHLFLLFTFLLSSHLFSLFRQSFLFPILLFIILLP